jgi:Required for respiratory growth protein 7
MFRSYLSHFLSKKLYKPTIGVNVAQPNLLPQYHGVVGRTSMRALSTSTAVHNVSIEPSVHSHVERGTHFENCSMDVLGSLHFAFERRGGAHDRGVDLRGWWRIPVNHQLMPMSSENTCIDQFSIPVIAQCKFESKPVGSKYMRELEGTLAQERVPTSQDASSESDPSAVIDTDCGSFESDDSTPSKRRRSLSGHMPLTTIGIFASASGYSPAAIKAFNQLTYPAAMASFRPIHSHTHAHSHATHKSLPQFELVSFRLNAEAKSLYPFILIGSQYEQGSKRITVMCDPNYVSKKEE